MSMMALVGFLIVFVVLILMIFVMKVLGYTFTRKVKTSRKSSVDISEEEVAAILTALKLYKSDIHDKETELLTIKRMSRAYSPWNSKIHGLTPLPEYRRRQW